MEFLNGDQTFVANAGDFVFVPRGTRHRFRNITGEMAHKADLAKRHADLAAARGTTKAA